MWTVYVHTCPNGKRYVGITSKNPKVRWNRGNGYHKQFFYKAIKKYGWDNIKHEIVAVVETIEEAAEMENKLIEQYKSAQREFGYNISPHTDSVEGMPRARHSEETRKKMSESAKARPMNTRNWSGLLESHKYLNLKGIPHNLSPQGANKLREANGKVIIQYDTDMNPIGAYESASCAMAVTGINPYPSVYDEKRKCGGFYWRYGEQLTEDERIKVVFSNVKLNYHNEEGELEHV